MLRMLIERTRWRGGGEALAAARAMACVHEIHGPDIYEELLAYANHAFLREGDVVIDVGAHAGRHLDQIYEIVGAGGRIVGFEPIPTFAADLRAKYAGSPHVEIHEAALGATPHRARFTYYENAAGLSGLRARTLELGYEPIVTPIDVKV